MPRENPRHLQKKRRLLRARAKAKAKAKAGAKNRREQQVSNSKLHIIHVLGVFGVSIAKTTKYLRPHYVRTLFVGEHIPEVCYHVFAQIGLNIRMNRFTQPNSFGYFGSSGQFNQLMQPFQGKNVVFVTSIAFSRILIKQLLRYKHPIVFSMHGITKPDAVRYVAQMWTKGISPDIQCLYLCGPIHRKIMETMHFDPKKYICLPGLVQIDYLLKMKEEIPSIRNHIYKTHGNKNRATSILIVQQHDRNSPLLKVLQMTHDAYPKARIYVKNKTHKGYLHCKNLVRSSPVRKYSTILSWTSLVYPYLCLDIVILIGFSSCYVESLLINPKTIMLVTKDALYTPPPPGLLVTQKLDDIRQYLEYTKGDFVKTEAYLEATRQLMMVYFDQESPQPVTPLIEKDLIKRFG
jgi:hypothetical protein